MDDFSECKISFTVFVVSVFGNNGLWDNGNGFILPICQVLSTSSISFSTCKSFYNFFISFGHII
jgi:hypothetical protein